MNQHKTKTKSLEHERIFKRAKIIIKDHQEGKYNNEPDAKTFLVEYMKKNGIKY